MAEIYEKWEKKFKIIVKQIYYLQYYVISVLYYAHNRNSFLARIGIFAEK